MPTILFLDCTQLYTMHSISELWSIQVEVCSGEGELSRALWSTGRKGKAFDVACLLRLQHSYAQPIFNSHCFRIFGLILVRVLVVSMKFGLDEVRYSRNHDLLRTVGFISVLAAVPGRVKTLSWIVYWFPTSKSFTN